MSITNKENIKDMYYLSPLQEGMLFHSMLDSGSRFYFEQMVFTLKGTLNPILLKKSFQQLVNRHDVLRTVFVYDKVKRPVQVVLKSREADLEFIDLTELDSERQQKVIDERMALEVEKGFDLRKDLLVRIIVYKISGSSYKFIWGHHHIIMDGWCFGIVIKELLGIYKLLESNLELDFGKPVPYSTYIKWLERQNKSNALEYWKDYLSGLEEQTVIEADIAGNEEKKYVFSEYKVNLNCELSHRVTELAKTTNVTLNSVFQAAWGFLLGKYNYSEDVVFGTVVSGRNYPVEGIERIVGLLINTIPVRVRIDQEKSFKELLKNVFDSYILSEEYSYISLADILSASEMKNTKIDNILIFENYLLDDEVKNASNGNTLYGFEFCDFNFSERINYNLCLTVIPAKEISLRFNYNKNVYTPQFIEILAERLINVLSQAAGNPETLASSITLLLPGEKEELLMDFNRTQVEYELDRNIYSLIGKQAQISKSGIAAVFKSEKVTYAQLESNVDRLCRNLKSKGIGKGMIVGILVNRSIGMLESILAVLKSGAAYMPLDPGYPPQRIKYMLEDSGAKFLLCNNGLGNEIGFEWEIIDIDKEEGIPQCEITEIQDSGVKGDDPAYVIYTSGSTGNPKGVVISHSAAINFINGMKEKIQFDDRKKVLALTTISFDIFFLETILPLTSGMTVIIADEPAQKNPALLSRLIVENDINIMQMTPSSLQLLYEYDNRLKCLNKVESLLLGGEALTSKQFNYLKENYKGRIFNVYGPTETTIWSTVKELTDGSKITIGTPIANTRVYILDKYMNLLPIGFKGELYIGGAGLSLGYLNKRELTESRFPKDPFMEGQRIYRTGDLARWLPDGELECFGRVDHQVKIRGHRIELGEIEYYISRYPGINSSAAVVRSNSQGDKSIWAFYTSDHEEVGPDGIKEYLLRHIPNYMVPAYFVKLEALPLTPNMKIDRKTLESIDVKYDSIKDVELPANPMEEIVYRIFKEVLGTEGDFDVNEDFFELGGHSIKATVLAARIHKETGKPVDLEQIFKLATVREIAKFISQAEEKAYVPIPKLPVKEFYPASPAQKRIFILDKLMECAYNYNMPTVLELSGNVEIQGIKTALSKLIERHELLRTCFEVLGDEIVQRISTDVKFELLYKEIDSNDLEEAIKNSIKPFNLGKAPLFRAILFKTEKEQMYLFMDIHHIIFDGSSKAILFDEFLKLYNGELLGEKNVQYKDYTEWYMKKLEKDSVKKQKEFWINEFSGEIPVLNLPTDFSRPIVQNFSGSRVRYTLKPEISALLNGFGKDFGATPYMILFAVFNILISKYSGQKSVVVGTPISGRNHPDLENMVGMLVNTLAIKSNINGDMSFAYYLNTHKQKLLEAFANQDFQFEDLVDELESRGHIKRDLSRNPLFDVMFSMQNSFEMERSTGKMNIRPHEFNFDVSRFDITFFAVEYKNDIYLDIEFSTELFERDTIERFAVHFENILDQVLKNPSLHIGHIELCTEQEKTQILEEFNGNNIQFDKGLNSIHGAYEKQAREVPQNIAVVDGDKQLTYKQLDETSNRFARYLSGLGAGRGAIVAIIMERSLDYVVSVLAVLKSGAAYIPIDISNPPERIEKILKETGTKIVISRTEDSTAAGLESILGSGCTDTENGKLVLKDKVQKDFENLDGGALENTSDKDDLLYLISTSGSTGVPKCVMLTHSNLLNLMHHQFNKTQIPFNRSRILQFASVGFDVSFQEIFSALLSGGTVFITPKKLKSNILKLLEFINENSIDVLFLPPAFLKYIFSEKHFKEKFPACVKHVITAGEQLVITDEIKDYMINGDVCIHNHYGPSETHVTTMYSMDKHSSIMEMPPIGKPISNTKIYIVDENGMILPCGIPGEMWIAGDSVGVGYFNNPIETQDKFVNNTYGTGKRMFKTGDLAKWLPDGNIQYIGRKDSQVKLRGFRIELEEIESELMRYPGIKETVVDLRKDSRGESYLSAYLKVEEAIDTNALKEFLSSKLPEYMVPSCFVTLDEIPLNINGKVDRRKLPEPVRVYEDAGVKEAETPVEAKLLGMFETLLKVSNIGVEQDFFELGGHSLKATVLATKIFKEFDVEMPLKEIFKAGTVRKIAEYITQTSVSVRFSSIVKAQEKDYYALSSAQKRLYIEYLMNRSSLSYNLPCFNIVHGELDESRIEYAVKQLIERHEALRTSFHIIDGMPCQKIDKNVGFAVEHIESPEYKGEEDLYKIAKDFIRPFDLETAPLLRVGLYTISDKKHFLLFDMHHIISDGVTMAILVKEFADIYNGVALPPQEFQYKDFSEWQNGLLERGALKRQENYWLEVFKDGIPELRLPYDFKDRSGSFEGDVVEFLLESETCKRLKELNLSTNTTLFMFSLSVLNIVLQKYTGQTEIVIGSPIAGRPHANLQNIMGMFVNILCIKNYPEDDKTFNEFLLQVRENAINAYENQDYQLDMLIEKLKLSGKPIGSSLLKVVYAMQNVDKPDSRLNGLAMEDYEEYKHATPNFEIIFGSVEKENGIAFRIGYSKSLFKRETIMKLAERFKKVATMVLENTEIKIKEIEIFDDITGIKPDIKALNEEDLDFNF